MLRLNSHSGLQKWSYVAITQQQKPGRSNGWPSPDLFDSWAILWILKNIKCSIWLTPVWTNRSMRSQSSRPVTGSGNWQEKYCFSLSKCPWAEWPGPWINTDCGLKQMLELLCKYTAICLNKLYLIYTLLSDFSILDVGTLLAEYLRSGRVVLTIV